jgi:Ankyrin repeats (3 copies)
LLKKVEEVLELYRSSNHFQDFSFISSYECHLLAEILRPDAELSEYITTFWLYEQFCRKKCREFINNEREKFNGDEASIMKVLQNLAMQTLFPKFPYLFVDDCEFFPWNVEGLTVEGGTKFAHLSLSHYFAALYLADMLQQRKRPTRFDEFFFRKLLVQNEQRTHVDLASNPWTSVRALLGQMYEQSPWQYGSDLMNIWITAIFSRNGAFKVAVFESNVGLARFLYNILKRFVSKFPHVHHRKQFNKYLTKVHVGYYMLVSGEKGRIPILEILLDITVAEKLDLKREVWHLVKTLDLREATLKSSIRIVERLLEYSVENGTEPAKVLCPDSDNFNLLMVAAQEGNDALLEMIIQFAKKHRVESTLFTCHRTGATLLHFAARGGCIKIIERIVNFAKENGQSVPNLMKPDSQGRTPLHDADLYDHPDALVILLKVATENGINHSVLIGQGKNG